MCVQEGAGNSFLAATSERADLNQYWFSKGTVAAFVAEITDAGGKAALVSSPSVYFSLPDDVRERSKVLDFDRQWESDPGFVFYDFNSPEAVPTELHGTFDFVLVDPPFITREVWEKYAITTRLLARDGAKVLCTTIAENEPMMLEILSLQPVPFRPSIPNLVYQYSVYVNYTSERLCRFNPEIDDADWREPASTATKAAAVGDNVDNVPIRGLAAVTASESARCADNVEGAGSLGITGAEATALPPDVVLLTDLREQLGALKRALEAMQVPLQIAVRRRQAGGEAAAAAAAKAEAALDGTAPLLDGLEKWLCEHRHQVAIALGQLSSEEDALPGSKAAALFEKWQSSDVWHCVAVRSLLNRASGGQIASMVAYQEFATCSRQCSTAIFRQSNMVLVRIKHLKKLAAPPVASQCAVDCGATLKASAQKST